MLWWSSMFGRATRMHIHARRDSTMHFNRTFQDAWDWRDATYYRSFQISDDDIAKVVAGGTADARIRATETRWVKIHGQQGAKGCRNEKRAGSVSVYKICMRIAVGRRCIPTTKTMMYVKSLVRSAPILFSPTLRTWLFATESTLAPLVVLWRKCKSPAAHAHFGEFGSELYIIRTRARILLKHENSAARYSIGIWRRAYILCL